MKIEIGDKVICLPGYNGNNSSKNYGGAGYKDGRIFTVADMSDDGRILWPDDGDGLGIYAYAVKHHTDRKNRIQNLNL